MNNSNVRMTPIDESYYTKYLTAPVKEVELEDLDSYSALESKDVFGSDENYTDTYSYSERENFRGYIKLYKPVLNNVLAGPNGDNLFQYLGIDSKLGNEIMNFTTVYNKKENQFVKVDKVKDARINDYLVGPEIIEMFCNNWDREKAYIEEIKRLLCRNCFVKNTYPDEIGTVEKTKGMDSISLTDGYYLNNIATDKLKQKYTLEILQNYFYYAICRRSSIQIIRNTTKVRLKNTIMHSIAVLPVIFRPKMNNIENQLTRAYSAVRRANSELSDSVRYSNASFATYVSLYKTLNKVANYVIYNHDPNKKKSKALGEMISGKKGFIRKNFISKRSDYSARAVVICDPKLKMNQIALPDNILAKIFMHDLMKKLKDPTEILALKSKSVKEIVDQMEMLNVFQGQATPLNRAPTLHRLSMLAYNVVRTSAHAIKVNTLLNEGYNMDHDGDTAAVNRPILPEAVAEVEGLLHANHNLFKPSDGKCTLTPRLDMIYGLYKLTYDYDLTDDPIPYNSYEEIWKDINAQTLKVWNTVIMEGVVTTAGKAYLAKALNNSKVYTKDMIVNSKTIENIVESILAEYDDNEVVLDILWKLSHIGFRIAKLYPAKLTVLTNLDYSHVKPVFDRFHKKIAELDEADSLGFCTEEDYSMEFDTHLEDLKKYIESAAIETIEGADISPAVLMLNGLYMATKNSYKMDRITDDADLTTVDSLDELCDLVLNRLVTVNETILFKGNRCLAGKQLVSSIAHKLVTKEIDASNIDSYMSEDVRILGLKLSNLFSDIDIEPKILNYRTGINRDMLGTLYELTKDAYEIDEEAYDEDLPKYDSVQRLEADIFSGKIKPSTTILYGNSVDRYIAGRKLLSEITGQDIFREIDEYSIKTFKNDKLISYGKKIAGKLKSDRESLDKFVDEDFRAGSDTVYQPNGFIDIVKSGARGKPSNLVQIFMFKGQIAKASGNPFSSIIENSFVTQLYPLEHFVAAYGSRKGVIAKSLTPAQTGYLERQLWHAPEDVVITEDDCGCTDGLHLTLNDIIAEKKDIDSNEESKIQDAKQELKRMIVGRYLLPEPNLVTKDKDGKEVAREKTVTNEFTNTIITVELADKLIKKIDRNTVINLRSPIKCKNPCCAKCYGIDLTIRSKAVRGLPIGFIASESIGEPGTQLTLKSFQSGGLASRKDSERTESARLSSKFKMTDITDCTKHPEYDPVAWLDGKTEVTPIDKDFNYVSIEGSKRKVKLYSDVEVKEIAKKGEPLCKIPGDQDIREKELFAGIDEAQKFLALSTYLIFSSVASVNFKHFEVIVSALRLRIVLNNPKGYKNIQTLIPYTRTEWVSKHVNKEDVEYVDILEGVNKIPLIRESCLSSVLMEDMKAGLRRSALIGNVDNLQNPFNAMIFGFNPNIGTEYNPNFIDERLKWEKRRFRIK